jgi:hypothetical protein
MSAAAGGILLQLWWRQRTALAIAGLYLAALALVVRLPQALDYRPTLFLCAVPLAFALIFIMAGCAYPDGDVLAVRSGYPRPMLWLPISTRDLAFWPVLAGGVVSVLGWALPTRLVLAPLGVNAPWLWPGVLSFAVLAWVQALFWTPFALPYARLLLSLTVIPAMTALGIILSYNGASEPVLCALFLALAGVGFAVGWSGLSAARRGDEAEASWRLPARIRPADRLPALPNPPSALVWEAWRTYGLQLPLGTAAVCFLFALPLIWVRDLLPIEPNFPRSDFGSLEVNVAVRVLAGLPFLPVLLAAIIGCEGHRTGPLSLFTATRPVSETARVAATYLTSVRSTLLSWAVVLGVGAGSLLLSARAGERTAPLWQLLLPYWNAGAAVTLALCLGLLILWTWINQVQGLCARATGRPWVVTTAVMGGTALLMAGFLAYINWTGQPRDMDFRYVSLPPGLHLWLAAAIAVKVLIGGAACFGQRKRLRVPADRLVAAAGAWLVIAVLVWAALWWLVRAGAPSGPLAQAIAGSWVFPCSAAAPDALRSPGYLAAMTVLFLPFGRLLLAPLAVHWNRHR